jgi:hypothetical protein
MIAEDSRWAMDVMLSSNRYPEVQGSVPLILGHHLVRIAYGDRWLYDHLIRSWECRR